MGSHGRNVRQTVAVSAALTAAGIVTVLNATPAQAGTGSVWDRVAECESSGDWHINTGNGFYGGLQFTSDTWAAYGGRAYASQAHLASRGEQITVAERVLRSQGPGAWPICGPRAGLGRSSGHTSRTVVPRVPVVPSEGDSNPLPVPEHYTVVPGDTLSGIAATHHVRRWQLLWSWNRNIIKNPDLIYPGQVLRVPPAQAQ